MPSSGAGRADRHALVDRLSVGRGGRGTCLAWSRCRALFEKCFRQSRTKAGLVELLLPLLFFLWVEGRWLAGVRRLLAEPNAGTGSSAVRSVEPEDTIHYGLNLCSKFYLTTEDADAELVHSFIEFVQGDRGLGCPA